MMAASVWMRASLVAFSLFATVGSALAAPACRAASELISLGTTLPRLAAAVHSGREPVIVALGSSSTEGVGASDPTRAYPARLAAELRDRHGMAVTVINKGVGGEVTTDMLRRLEQDVLVHVPALVIWQTGSNTAMRHVDPGNHHKAMIEGLERLSAAGVDVVVMDPQYAPRIIAAPRHQEIVAQLQEEADRAGAGVFHRFRIMRSWHEAGIGFDETLSPDGVHMNDWSYGCVARLLADALATAIGRQTIPPTAMAAD
jgi:acyl-CoA thioesterase I